MGTASDDFRSRASQAITRKHWLVVAAVVAKLVAAAVVVVVARNMIAAVAAKLVPAWRQPQSTHCSSGSLLQPTEPSLAAANTGCSSKTLLAFQPL